MIRAPVPPPSVIEALRRLLEGSGHHFVTPGVLQPAEMFLALAGEDLRRRMFLTEGRDGSELCLRPDMTIPVCRLHLDDGAAERQGFYAYLGPVFRQRADGVGEFFQAGIERLGETDREAADAETLALALEAASALGLGGHSGVRVGDEALFSAVVEALPLPVAWRRRLTALFGDTPRLASALDKLDGRAGADSPAAVAGALAEADPATARALVEDMLAVAGLSPVGGRSAAEIADRLIEQATLAAGARLAPEAAATLRAFLAIDASADAAVDELSRFAAKAGLGLDGAIGAFARRNDLLAARGVAVGDLRFSAEFGRRLDYYTGFMFELHDRRQPRLGEVIGGGRYDRMVALLGASAPVPAVGFSIWLDRVVSEEAAR